MFMFHYYMTVRATTSVEPKVRTRTCGTVAPLVLAHIAATKLVYQTHARTCIIIAMGPCRYTSFQPSLLAHLSFQGAAQFHRSAPHPSPPSVQRWGAAQYCHSAPRTAESQGTAPQGWSTADLWGRHNGSGRTAAVCRLQACLDTVREYVYYTNFSFKM